jgi:hypothetical protein
MFTFLVVRNQNVQHWVVSNAVTFLLIVMQTGQRVHTSYSLQQWREATVMQK